MRIGLPRALMYYEFYPLWRTFFEGLGLEVVPSHPTTKRILEAGIKLAVDEACLPVKLALGHVADLAGRCDAIFVPRLITIEHNGFLCPKLVGFPDMVRAMPARLPPLVTPAIDYNRNPDRFRPYLEAARALKRSSRLARRAFAKAEEAQSRFEESLRAGRRLKLAISDFERGEIPAAAQRGDQQMLPRRPDDVARPAGPDIAAQEVPAGTTEAHPERLRIAIFGHPYNVHDPYLSLDIGERLEGLGCEVVSAEQVWNEECEQALAEYGKNVYWVFARRVLGPVMHFMRSEDHEIDGLVYVVSFGCGPDALVKALVDLMAKQNPDLPYMAVVLDEHSAEGGLLTRLEAFVDMTRRVRRRRAEGPAASEDEPLRTAGPRHTRPPPPRLRRAASFEVPKGRTGARAPEARKEAVSFAHVGLLWIPLRAMLEDLGLRVVVPPEPTRRTLDIGSQHSPELACIPFKLTLGGYVEALERGATHLLGLSSRFGASCRLYFFPTVHEAILRDMGYDFEIVAIDSGRRDSGGEMARLVKERIDKSFWEFAKAFFGAFWRKLVACEKVEMLAVETRAYEMNKGEATRIMRRSLARIDRSEPRRLRRLMRSVEDEFRSVERTREHRPLRIGIIGELFVLLDQFANHEIERRLGEMGVLARRNFWISKKLLRTVWRWFDPEYARAMKAASRYLGVDVGAECNVTVGDTVELRKHGHDGLVHLMPFTCMPEIVAESILPRAKADSGMPVISFALDEQTSDVGMQTRLEAFVDLLARQRSHAGKV